MSDSVVLGQMIGRADELEKQNIQNRSRENGKRMAVFTNAKTRWLQVCMQMKFLTHQVDEPTCFAYIVPEYDL